MCGREEEREKEIEKGECKRSCFNKITYLNIAYSKMSTYQRKMRHIKIKLLFNTLLDGKH